MSQLTMLDVRNFIVDTLSSIDSKLILSNAINRNSKTSIGVYSAPESRMGKLDTYGGIDLAPVSTYPINILVRWTEDSDACEKCANDIYTALSSLGNNFLIKPKDFSSTKIAYVKLLDSHPVWLGRDKDNVCEFSIRVDIIYYN